MSESTINVFLAIVVLFTALLAIVWYVFVPILRTAGGLS